MKSENITRLKRIRFSIDTLFLLLTFVLPLFSDELLTSTDKTVI